MKGILRVPVLKFFRFLRKISLNFIKIHEKKNLQNFSKFFHKKIPEQTNKIPLSRTRIFLRKIPALITMQFISAIITHLTFDSLRSALKRARREKQLLNPSRNRCATWGDNNILNISLKTTIIFNKYYYREIRGF